MHLQWSIYKYKDRCNDALLYGNWYFLSKWHISSKNPQKINNKKAFDRWVNGLSHANHQFQNCDNFSFKVLLKMHQVLLTYKKNCLEWLKKIKNMVDHLIKRLEMCNLYQKSFQVHKISFNSNNSPWCF